MGIKTYNLIETVDMLKKHGVDVWVSGKSLYVPGKVVMREDAGSYQVFTEEDGMAYLIKSTVDEDDACREVLKAVGIKTIKHKGAKKA